MVNSEICPGGHQANEIHTLWVPQMLCFPLGKSNITAKKKKRELKNSQAIVGIMCLSMVIEEDTLAIYSPTIAIIDHSLVRLH